MYKVMIVDDEPLTRHGIAYSIDWNELGFVICAMADNGLEAIQKYQTHTPDVIISDINMPKMSGIEMLNQLRDEGSDVKVIFLTAYSEFSYARDALRLFAADYILKPFEDGELEQSLIKLKPSLRQKSKLKEGQDSNRYVKNAVVIIQKEYANPNLSISMIASVLQISEGHLSRLFHKEKEITITTYITNYRLEMAKNLLKDIHLRINEVALAVGYLDVAYFSSLFKKNFGMSPSDYQNL